MTKKGKIISLTALFLTALLLFVFNNKQHKDRYPLVKPVSDFAKKQKTSIVQDSAKPEIKSCDFQYKKAVVSICEPDRVNFDIAKLPQKGKKHDVSTFGKDKIGFTVNKPGKSAPNPVIFSITFDNDIFDETDYYYTNGIRFSLITPVARRTLLNKTLIGNRNSSVVLAGFSLRQNMYTATNPETPVILKGDHPFAGYLVFGQFLQTVNFENRVSVFSEISLGVIGPASLAASIQRGVHEKYPAGWDYQINNDIIVNYALKVEKSLISNKNFEINATTKINAGTLFDDLSAGLFMRTGSFIPVYRGMPLSKNNKLRYWFFIKSNLKGVIYDATLQGGMFSNSPYTIPGNQINRLVFTASAGLAFYYYSIGLELENFYQTPEFKGALDFKWGRINLVLKF